MSLEADVLRGLHPTADEAERMARTVQDLVAACQRAMADAGLDGHATVQGSIAKDTWISGNTDLDCFLLLDPATDPDQLKAAAESVGSVLENPRKKYAQHPYLVGEFQEMQVDLVPAYAVPSAGEKMSAVDRTPFHTAWVLEHLDAAQREDVRLLKQWCKGVGIYGAETATGGFSGYLLEVLCHALHGFQGVLDWFQKDAQPRRIAVGDDHVDDDVSCLIVVDPVDAARNCAAAVQPAALERAHEAAVAYADAPTKAFFHPPPANPEPAEVLDDAMRAQGTQWIGLVGTPATDRLDIVFPQFQKAARTVCNELERAGFTVHRHQVDVYDNERRVGMQWLVDAAPLPAQRTHRGPVAGKEPNAGKFRAKWAAHPDALGPAEDVDGRLEVQVAIRHRTVAEHLGANLATYPLGKHAAAALPDPSILTRPANVDGDWAARVTELVLDRRPWQR